MHREKRDERYEFLFERQHRADNIENNADGFADFGNKIHHNGFSLICSAA
jgi:hypothetical protein